MPNLLIKVKKSTTGAYSSQISKHEKKKIEKDFSFFGNMIWLKNEKQMHFFTAFFGGGPAYISLFLEILSKILFQGLLMKNSQGSLFLILPTELLNLQK